METPGEVRNKPQAERTGLPDDSSDRIRDKEESKKWMKCQLLGQGRLGVARPGGREGFCFGCVQFEPLKDTSQDYKQVGVDIHI